MAWTRPGRLITRPGHERVRGTGPVPLTFTSAGSQGDIPSLWDRRFSCAKPSRVSEVLCPLQETCCPVSLPPCRVQV